MVLFIIFFGREKEFEVRERFKLGDWRSLGGRVILRVGGFEEG